jgi:hypothetical protein
MKLNYMLPPVVTKPTAKASQVANDLVSAVDGVDAAAAAAAAAAEAAAKAAAAEADAPKPIMPFNGYGCTIHNMVITLVTVPHQAKRTPPSARFTMGSTGGYLTIMERELHRRHQHAKKTADPAYKYNDRMHWADVTFFCSPKTYTTII